ncbi:MAG: KH domain-containing protein, partial [Atopostipes suicloacalis]|nr:KH domain-containing protein [Atopostipes suicloacalis]
EPKEKNEEKQTKINDKLNDDEAVKAVRDYLKNIILAMGISDVEVYTSRIKNQVKYDIETGNAGLVIGRHGKVLNGLQTLIQNHMHQLAESKIFVRVDAEKYRERRRNTVESLARRTADRAIKTKKAVKLDPMPAYERKQIHHYLNKNSKVDTHSEGREPKRYLVVKPLEK